jgi:hypothetical protein
MANDIDSLVKTLLDRHGQTYCREIGIHLEAGASASPLFQLLCAATLMSARISAESAVQAMKALINAGWITADKMAETTWEERVRVLNENGYARYDEKTSRFLGETCELLLEKYQGDLRTLRERCDCDPNKYREALKEFKGMGDVGVDIFFREVQLAWDELHPFCDEKARRSATRLGLPKNPQTLANLVDRQDFPRLVAALVRADLAGDHQEIRQQAA